MRLGRVCVAVLVIWAMGGRLDRDGGVGVKDEVCSSH